MSYRPITHAFVRHVSRSLAACNLLHLSRQEFDLPRAVQQHSEYVQALESAGVDVRVLAEQPLLPDSTFVEDPVLVLDEIAIGCRLGSTSREPEAEILVRELAGLRPISKILAPGLVEGGDVLQIGKTLFVGLSTRTNRPGLDQVRRLVEPFGYNVVEVTVTGCLHLKTGITSPAEGLLVANPRWIDLSAFAAFEIISVPEAEPWGANTLPVNGRVLVATSGPRTAAMLESRGLDVHRLDISELQKAEAGLTCLSVLYSEKVGYGLRQVSIAKSE